MSDGWIGVDLDGTLATYDEWQGPEHVGVPIPAMVERIKRWLAEGREVRILTARMSDPDPTTQGMVFQAVYHWTKLHIGTALRATCKKDYAMIELWDDRAVQVEMNTGKRIGYSTRGTDGD